MILVSLGGVGTPGYFSLCFSRASTALMYVVRLSGSHGSQVLECRILKWGVGQKEVLELPHRTAPCTTGRHGLNLARSLRSTEGQRQW